MHDVSDFENEFEYALATYADPTDAGYPQALTARVMAAIGARRRKRQWLLGVSIAAPGLACLLIAISLYLPRHEPQQQAANLASVPAVLPPAIAPTVPSHPKLETARHEIVRNAPRQLPKLDQFPAPAPMTEQEQLLMQFVGHTPASTQQTIAKAQTQSEEPLRIAELAILSRSKDSASMTGATMPQIVILFFSLVLFATPNAVFAQQDAKPSEVPAHYYQLSFSVQEVGENGKVSNSRSYATSIVTGPGSYSQIRTGDKVPLKTDDKGNLQYMDVGVNVDCSRAAEVNGKLAVQITADISSTTKAIDPSAPPLIRQSRWSANVLVPIGKPTIVLSSDDLQDKGKLQVELTATRIE
jgi:hypothetical protein